MFSEWPTTCPVSTGVLHAGSSQTLTEIPGILFLLNDLIPNASKSMFQTINGIE